ncbi:DUF4342 domain-containing protein [Clostridium psychrophilum]|uniref:DUF4342 domain-containing protein n=1 Tax=Clostridium psychrophilum TaxID=132926 RepID=UPI001C0B12F5|nr:DUF4342 domain-containing protein [Clostridium psychrophilum]MBU3182653.1 DUF4342 domain-containing protein [Clostridium psychrophilum]
MSINLDQIDELRKRANVSYGDAKNALEETGGNIIEALIYLEKQNKIKPEENTCCKNNFLKTLKSIIKKANGTKLIIKKNDVVVLNVCVTIAIIISIIAPPLVIALLIFCLITNHKIRIRKKNSEDSEVNRIFDKMAVVANKVTTKITKNFKTE